MINKIGELCFGKEGLEKRDLRKKQIRISIILSDKVKEDKTICHFLFIPKSRNCRACGKPREPQKQYCGECRKRRYKESSKRSLQKNYLKYREKMYLTNKRWRERNPEKIREINRKFYLKHREEIIKEYREKEDFWKNEPVKDQLKKMNELSIKLLNGGKDESRRNKRIYRETEEARN